MVKELKNLKTIWQPHPQTAEKSKECHYCCTATLIDTHTGFKSRRQLLDKKDLKTILRQLFLSSTPGFSLFFPHHLQPPDIYIKRKRQAFRGLVDMCLVMGIDVFVLSVKLYNFYLKNTFLKIKIK